MDSHNTTIYKTSKFYKENNKPVHIRLTNGKYLRGYILSINEDFKDRLVLAEETYGEILVLFERIQEDGILPRIPKP